MLSAKTPPGEGLSKLPETAPTVAVPDDAQRSTGRARMELRHPGYFLNRELTWLTFNHRVLNEADDKRTPLLERVKFLAIVGSNLDEFHMKRLGGLKQQVGAELLELTVDGRTPRQQIEESRAAVREMGEKAEAIRVRLLKALAQRGVELVSYASVSEEDRAWLRQHYVDNVFPLVTPQAIDPAHPFPFVSNLSVNLLVAARAPDESAAVLARVKLPLGGGIPRLVRIRDTLTFVTLEELVSNNLDLLFPGCASGSSRRWCGSR
jgi:polyphosphate kinase